jgi:hypothetical protein
MTAWTIERDPGAYVTEIAVTPEPRELQVLHSPMPEPELDETRSMRQGPRKLPGRAAPVRSEPESKGTDQCQHPRPGPRARGCPAARN